MLIVAGSAVAQPAAPLILRTRIELPGVNGRIDHLAVDTKGRRLFVAALGNNTIEVLDVQAAKRVHTIAGLAEPQGLLFEPSTNRLFAASAGDGTTKVFDGANFQLLNTAKLSSDADNVRYDSRGSRVVVGYGDGALALLDADGKKTGEIAIDAHPESFQIEPSGIRVFVNVPNRSEIEVADLSNKSVLAKWPVRMGSKNYPMALDLSHRRLLIGCRAPARMLVFDTESGKQTASVEIVGDTDDLFYDSSNARVYVIGGQGFIDILEQNDPDHYSRLERVPTAAGARTGLFVGVWRTLFVAVPHRGAQRSEIIAYDTK